MLPGPCGTQRDSIIHAAGTLQDPTGPCWGGEGEEGLDEHFSPEIAWDTIREPVLKALDALGKNDKNLQPTQWMCGLAGSIAAFAEAKSELAQANALMGELMTLRKESIQLRTRNAVLERELAEMETRMPAGGANSDAM